MSFKKAIHTKEHRERSQLSSREHLGLLEKKKDYILRAKDFHTKEKRLKNLKEKAEQRNPDEFYFKMQSEKTNQGVHQAERRHEKLDLSTIKLLKTQDQNYVNYQRSVNLKKLDRLKENMHLVQIDEEEDSFIKHTIFVENENEAKHFNPSEHFNTLPEFMDRKFNRPTKEILEQDCIIGDLKNQRGLVKIKEKNIREMASRIEREEKLLAAKMEMELQRNLMGKGPRKKVRVDEKGLPVFKWKAVRKK